MGRILKYILTLGPLALLGTAIVTSLPGIKRYAVIRKNARSKNQRPTTKRP